MTSVSNEFRRYGIHSDDIQALRLKVIEVGGRNTVPAAKTSQVMMSLTDEMVNKLISMGYNPVLVQPITPGVTPPLQIVGAAVFTPQDLLNLLGMNQFKLAVTPALSGAGYNIAVIGTGMRTSHSLLGGRVIYSKNFTNDPVADGFNHDTGVASIIHAVAPDVGILNMKVINSTGNGTEEAVVLAIDDCIRLLDANPALAPNIINMSLGSNDDNNPSNVVRVACRAAIERGFVLVASAGNNGSARGAVTVPACEENVAAIGSLSSNPLGISTFSSRGPTLGGLIKPDAVFLGENIIMASSADDTSTISKSGTSFSAPLTSGLIALTMEGIARTQTIPANQFVGKNVLTGKRVIVDMLPQVCIKPQSVVDRLKDNDYGYGVPVGSLMVENTGVGVVGIDWNSSLNLSVTLMIIQLMAGMMTSLG